MQTDEGDVRDLEIDSDLDSFNGSDSDVSDIEIDSDSEFLNDSDYVDIYG